MEMLRRITAATGIRTYLVEALFAVATILFSLFSTDLSLADEGGVSFWIPGFYGSLAATPQEPGWSIAAVYYHASPAYSRLKTDSRVADQYR
jgi:hypothetical protein